VFSISGGVAALADSQKTTTSRNAVAVVVEDSILSACWMGRWSNLCLAERLEAVQSKNVQVLIRCSQQIVHSDSEIHDGFDLCEQCGKFFLGVYLSISNALQNRFT